MHKTSSQIIGVAGVGNGSPDHIVKRKTTMDRLNGHKDFDPVTFDVLMVKPVDFATQITLLDLPAFKAIEPDELTSCGWTRKEKKLISPNVVTFTNRFNLVCLWCQREIIASANTSRRADILVHFIKVAKSLLELNNFHSAFAVISALQSEPITRLSMSWATVSRSDRASLEKMALIFASEDNWSRLRAMLQTSTKLPCIPHLGLFLTDLIHIDLVHPRTGIVDGKPREEKMNNVLRILAYFQDSNYDHLVRIECIQKYFHSMKFHEEFIKFAEDEIHRLSLEREPHKLSFDSKSPALRSADIRRVTDTEHAVKSNSLKHHTAAAAAAAASISPFRSRHRKTKSLGCNSLFGCENRSFGGLNEALETSGRCISRNLIDDSVDANLSIDGCTSSSTDVTNRCRNESIRTGDFDTMLLASEGDMLPTLFYQSAIRMSVIRKEKSRRVKIPSVRWYWMSLVGTTLYFFAEKPFYLLIKFLHSEKRSAYRSNECKCLSMNDWHALASNDDAGNSFTLHYPTSGKIYRIECMKRLDAKNWLDQLNAARLKHHPRAPTNLISL